MDLFVPLLMVIILTVLTAVVLARVLPPDEARDVFRLCLVGLGVRVALATVFLLVEETRLFHEDASGYERIGILLARGWKGEIPPYPMPKVVNLGYFYFCGVLAFMFGSFRGLPSFFNCWAGIATVIVIYLLARHVFHRVVARRALLFGLFFPSMIIWSSTAVKDTLMVLLIAVCLYSVVRLRERFTWLAVLGTILPMVAVLSIRFYIFYLLVVASAGSFVLFSRRLGASVGKQLAVIVSIAAVVMVLGLRREVSAGAEQITLSRVSATRQALASTAKSGYRGEVDVSTPARALAFLPVGVMFLLFSPFPWQFTSVRSLMTLPEMIVWWALLPAWIRGLRWAVRYQRELLAPVFVFTLLLTMAYGTFHGNVGVAFRQRVQITVFLYIFAALGMYLKRCRRLGLPETILLAGYRPPALPSAAGAAHAATRSAAA